MKPTQNFCSACGVLAAKATVNAKKIARGRHSENDQSLASTWWSPVQLRNPRFCARKSLNLVRSFDPISPEGSHSHETETGLCPSHVSGQDGLGPRNLLGTRPPLPQRRRVFPGCTDPGGAQAAFSSAGKSSMHPKRNCRCVNLHPWTGTTGLCAPRKCRMEHAGPASHDQGCRVLRTPVTPAFRCSSNGVSAPDARCSDRGRNSHFQNRKFHSRPTECRG